MNYPKYKITSEISSSWFGKPLVVYKLWQIDEVWDDPTYGNGGGSFCEQQKMIFKSISLRDIHDTQRKLEIRK